MFRNLINEMVRVDQILDAELIPEKNAGCGDPGWGAEGSKLPNVHFNTSIAKSYHMLERTALSRRPGLTHRNSRSFVCPLALVLLSLLHSHSSSTGASETAQPTKTPNAGGCEITWRSLSVHSLA